MKIEFNGRSQSVAAWGRELGISRHVIEDRLRRGWSVERALTEPLNAPNNPPHTPRMIEHNGRSQSIAEWANEFGIEYINLLRRLNAGWPIERALTERVKTTPYRGRLWYNGIMKSVKEWSAETGISEFAIYGRLADGWSI
jgi:hypothetical protein